MTTPEEKLNIMISELQGDLIGLDNLTKILLDLFDKNLKEGSELTDFDIQFINEMWWCRDKRRCNFCNTNTYTQDEDCVDCGFSKTYGSRK